MKFLITALLFVSAIFADEPPDWNTHFKEFSENKKFLAVVSPIETKSVKSPWEMKYRLDVNSIIANKQKLLWSSVYIHSGYSQIMVSNDGNYVVYIEYWFVEDSPLVRVYSKNSRKEWSAKSLSISKFLLPKTVSHHLWIKGEVVFIENSKGITTALKIPTYKGIKTIQLVNK